MLAAVRAGAAGSLSGRSNENCRTRLSKLKSEYSIATAFIRLTILNNTYITIFAEAGIFTKVRICTSFANYPKFISFTSSQASQTRKTHKLHKFLKRQEWHKLREGHEIHKLHKHHDFNKK